MPRDIRSHPDAPDLERLGDLRLDPVPQDEIRRRRADGEMLVEDVVNERADLDVHAPMSDAPGESVEGDVGTALYRLVQLFGTPPFPEYAAGEDISDRGETTYAYLFRAQVEDAADDLPEEWLMTVRDWKLEVGVGVCEWRDREEDFEADPAVALTSMALARNVVTEPVECEYEGVWY